MVRVHSGLHYPISAFLGIFQSQTSARFYVGSTTMRADREACAFRFLSYRIEHDAVGRCELLKLLVWNGHSFLRARRMEATRVAPRSFL